MLTTLPKWEDIYRAGGHGLALDSKKYIFAYFTVKGTFQDRDLWVRLGGSVNYNIYERRSKKIYKTVKFCIQSKRIGDSDNWAVTIDHDEIRCLGTLFNDLKKETTLKGLFHGLYRDHWEKSPLDPKPVKRRTGFKFQRGVVYPPGFAVVDCAANYHTW